MASFSLHKGPWIPKSGANLAGVTVYECNHMTLRQHTKVSNTLDMSKMDMKWSEEDTCLNPDVMASFSLCKGPWIPNFGANLAGVTL